MRLRKAVQIFVTFILISGSAAGSETHSLFTQILQDYVHTGLVDYRALCSDSRLEEYIGQLVKTNPDTIPTDEGKLAFWLNAYNAYTLKVICDNYPVESINDLHFGGLIIGTVLKKTIWDEDFVIINHEKMTLNEIEHEIIRPVFKDPRAHFGLVCASIGCPPLRNEAFEAAKLDEQLDDQGRKFLRDTSKNNFDLSERIARISKIFDWFSGDFGKNDAEILIYIAQFLPDDIAGAIRSNPKQWKVKHTKYDWDLNEIQIGTN